MRDRPPGRRCSQVAESTMGRSRTRDARGNRGAPLHFDAGLAFGTRRRTFTRRQRLFVDELFQFLARLEVWDFLRRDVHLVASLGVAALAGLALAEAEAAEAAQLDLLAALQGVDDAGEDGIDDQFGVLLGEIGDPRDFFDK